MATSAVPLVKARLLELVLAEPAFNEVQTVYGTPGRDLERECLFVGATESWDQEWGALGARARNERFGLVFGIYVRSPGQSQQEATERCFEILASFESLLRATPSLGLSDTVRDVQVTFGRLDEWPTDEGKHALVVGTVNVNARI